MRSPKKISIQDGLSQQQRELAALHDHYIPVYELDWVNVFSLMREYARAAKMDGLFLGQELAVVTLLLSMDENRPDIQKSVERGEGAQGYKKLLQFCEKELSLTQSAAGKELRTLIRDLVHGVAMDYGPSDTWQGWSVQSALMQAVQMAQAKARDLLPIMMDSGLNEPAMAIYAVFARLHERVMVQVNQLPSRRLQFYSEKVLQDTIQPVVPDRVHLIVPLQGTVREEFLESGTEFSAVDPSDGSEIQFRSVSPAFLNDTVVQEIRTLHFQDGIAWENRIPVYEPSENVSESNLTPYPLFGKTRDGLRLDTEKMAPLGFAIASPILYLREGTREIHFRFDYEPDSVRGSVFDPGDYQDQSRANQCEAFVSTFKDIFIVSATSLEGWFRITEYNPSFHLLDSNIPKGSLSIRIRLSAEVPELVPYDSKIHGELCSTKLPVFRFMLNPEACGHCFDFLPQWVIRQIHIDVQVEDCHQLVLENQIGPLSAMAPFQPFGPIPALGDYLIMGCQETLGKNLRQFQIEIEWGGLPENCTDFWEWYEGYDQRPTTKQFMVRLAALSEGRWHPHGAEYPVMARLFQSENTDPTRIRISPITKIAFQSVLPSEMALNAEEWNREFHYGPHTKNGFFKITLGAPQGAFQHQEYPHILSKILTYNSKVKSEHLAKTLPHSPYTPVIRSIRASYKATATISLSHTAKSLEESSRPSLLYLHPWGWEYSSQREGSKRTLMPQYSESGSFYLGLRMEAIHSMVSLYFHLSRDSEQVPENVKRFFTWSYLSERGWVSLPPQYLQEDSTHYFTCSGIVHLVLPQDMSSNHSLMPKGLYWIRVSAVDECLFCCRAFSVYAQALEAERVVLAPNTHLDHLPSGSISSIKKSFAGLGGVYQVAPTWGGRSVETSKNQRIRVAERLLHKNRAYIPEDFERLVLGEFPEVFKVKCFSGIHPERPHQSSPGHITLVPLSHLFSDGRQQWKPKLSGHTLLQIHAYLKPLMPPSAVLHVINPVFERIQVRCSIQFVNSKSSGVWIEQLNDAICEYLSPWHADSGYTTHFGWCVRRHDIESFIRKQSYVEQVLDCSLIRISSQKRDCFDVDQEGDCDTDEFRAEIPWSIAVPMRKHYLNVNDGISGGSPLSVGIGDLEIGTTFILQPGKNNGEN